MNVPFLYGNDLAGDSKQRFQFGGAAPLVHDDFDHLDDLLGNLPAAGTGLRFGFVSNHSSIRLLLGRHEHNPATPVAASRTAGIDVHAL